MPVSDSTLGDAVIATHLSKSYDDTEALRDINLTIKPGEFVAPLALLVAARPYAESWLVWNTVKRSQLFAFSPEEACRSAQVGALSSNPLWLTQERLAEMYHFP